MLVSSEEAVTMYARYCRARFGKAARYDIWTKVAEEIDKHKSRGRPAH
jgi:hypothetical protein